MIRFWLLIAALLWNVLVFILGGCVSAPSTTPRSVEGEVPKIELGPLIKILEGRTIDDSIHVVVDQGGTAHVLIASHGLSKTLELIIRGDSVIDRRVVQAGGKPSSVDAAYDRQGRLHALVATEHYIFSKDRWEKTAETPWDKACISVESAHFVPGAPDLVWTFQVSGSDVGSPIRFEIRGAGSGSYGLIWPWLSRGIRTALVSDTGEGYGPWVVMEPYGKNDTSLADAASDDRGNVSILYRNPSYKGGLLTGLKSRYANIPVQMLRDSRPRTGKYVDTQCGSTLIIPAEGSDLPFYNTDMLAIDPESSTAIIKMCPPSTENKSCSSWLNSGAGWHSPVTMPVTGMARAMPGGNNSFDAVVAGGPLLSLVKKDFPIVFLHFEKGRWSAPVDLGMAHPGSSWNTGPFWGDIWHKISIAESSAGSAFIAWPTKDSIVGCWVHHATP